MAVYYKFKSAKDFDSIAMDGPFISVGVLKEKIFESKHLGRGTDFDLVVTNAQTNEEYLDEAMLIPKNTSVLIRRVPGRPRMPITTEQEPKVESQALDFQTERMSSMSNPVEDLKNNVEDSEFDEFGNDLYSIPETLPIVSTNTIPDIMPTSKADEENKIKALINTPALDWQRQGADNFGPGRGFGRGSGRMAGRGFGLERKTPPQGYVCHRCNTPGHYIQHCPTNGDPAYNIKRLKNPTGVPKSMLMSTPDGSYMLPGGAVAILKPNEAEFEKEIEGLPSTRPIGELPPELHCPLCKEVMKDAVLTSKCCFKSFCDKCIRDYIISKSMCICGATNILADDLLPNKTLRDTINRIMESGTSSADNPGSAPHVLDLESARDLQPKVPSPSISAASKGEPKLWQQTEGSQKIEGGDGVKAVTVPQQISEGVRLVKVADASEATRDSLSIRESVSQGSAPVVEEEVPQKAASGEAAKKKKKKKVLRPPMNDIPWRNPLDQVAENYMMPVGPNFNPYWNGGMQPGMDGFMAPPYPGGMPYMGYAMGPLGPMDMPPFAGVMPRDPFAPPYMMPPVVPPHRDLALGMGMNVPLPIMSREEFEARKVDLRRKRENERRGEGRELSREVPRDRDYTKEMGAVAAADSSGKQKSKSNPQISGPDHHYERRRSPHEHPSDRLQPPPRPAKRKSEHHDRDRDRDRDYDRDRDLDWARDYDRDRDLDRARDYDRDRARDYDRDRDKDHGDRDHHHRHLSDSSKKPASADTLKPKSSLSSAAAAAKHKSSVFSRISYPIEEPSKKHKASEAPNPSKSTTHHHHHHHHESSSSNGYYDGHRSHSSTKGAPSGGGPSAPQTTRAPSVSANNHESSDDERHFKRKPSRYGVSPPLEAGDRDDDEGRHPRGSRRRDRGGR